VRELPLGNLLQAHSIIAADRECWGAGGGADGSTLQNCALIRNFAFNYGGGASDSTLYNCSLTRNLTWGGGGGAAYSTLNNCIVYDNTNSFIIDAHRVDNYLSCFLNYCCTIPSTLNGLGIITNAPLFVDAAGGNLRLQSNSPCINAGLNEYVTTSTDLDTRPRIIGAAVDMGAYEFQGPFNDWLQQYGFQTDGSSDFADPDQDGLNNYQEWIAGTVPTDASSALRLLRPSIGSPGITLSWQSVTDRIYSLERATNLAGQPPFSLLTSNIVGHPTTTSYTDTNAVGPGPFFYRVGVQR
jgi:hypothetical protein